MKLKDNVKTEGNLNNEDKLKNEDGFKIEDDLKIRYDLENEDEEDPKEDSLKDRNVILRTVPRTSYSSSPCF